MGWVPLGLYQTGTVYAGLRGTIVGLFVVKGVRICGKSSFCQQQDTHDVDRQRGSDEDRGKGDDQCSVVGCDRVDGWNQGKQNESYGCKECQGSPHFVRERYRAFEFVGHPPLLCLLCIYYNRCGYFGI